MKYDRPVWQLMYDCAAAVPEPFRYEDVHRWFARFYPEVGQATIRAHLVGMSEGGRPKQAQFASRAPLFRRVARGMYAVIPEAERKIDPDLPPTAGPDLSSGGGADRFAASAFDDATVVSASDARDTHDASSAETSFEEMIERAGLAAEPLVVADPTAESADVLLLASEGERVLVPAPAREVFRSSTFQTARLRAERRGATWYVLSAEHGLLEPSEWVSPESRALADLDPHYRLVWAQWVLARLQSLNGPVDGLRVHVEAPPAYVGPLAAVLQDAGAEVSTAPVQPGGAAGVVSPRTRGSVQDRHAPTETDDAPTPPVGPSPVADTSVATASVVMAPSAPVDESEVADIVRHLADGDHAVPAAQLDGIQDVPGLFAWHVDAAGARQLNRSLMLPVGKGALHVGHAGALGRSPGTVWSLRHMVQDVQVGGRTRASTFRSSLAAILREPLKMHTWDDPVLTRWMEDHLRVVTWPTADRASILALAHRVVAELEPPLNVDHLRATEMRQRLGQLRASFG